MKLFAIITAGLMAAGGSAYYFGFSECSKHSCSSSPVATTGGCCSVGDKPDCCSPKEECCVLQEACCSVATNVSASVKKSSCCAAKEECCLVSAACSTAEKISATAKPIEIEGCCDSHVSPTRNVTNAAKTIASVK